MKDGADILIKYFPSLTAEQKDMFSKMKPLYEDWNAKINLISRQDVDHFYERHVLHSLAISKASPFRDGSAIMDLGTGGGFPGLPLAIYFPACRFLLVDSIRKKTTAVQAVINGIGLKNAEAVWSRAEDVEGRFDAVVTRAVARTAQLVEWTHDRTRHLLALKGGDLSAELAEVKTGISSRTWPVSSWFDGEFFETKVVLDIKW